MQKGDVVFGGLVPTDQDVPEAVQPTVGAFHHSASGFETSPSFDGLSLLASAADVGGEIELVQRATHLGEVVALVRAHPLGMFGAGAGRSAAARSIVARLKLLIIDQLGVVPLSTTVAELLFEVFSQPYERGTVLVTTTLPFDEWTLVFGSERRNGALLGSPQPPRPHHRDERRQLPSQSQPAKRCLSGSSWTGQRIDRSCLQLPSAGPSAKSQAMSSQSNTAPMARFSSAVEAQHPSP